MAPRPPANDPDAAIHARLRQLIHSGAPADKGLRRELGRLAESRDPDALALLREALASRQPQVRALAALALGRSAFPEAAASLVPCLQDPSEAVVCATVQALGEADPATLRQWGLPAVQAGSLPAGVTAEILMALARQGDETAIGLAMAAAADGTDEALVDGMLERLEEVPAAVSLPLLQTIVVAAADRASTRAEAFAAMSDVAAPEAAALLLQHARQRSGASDRRQAAAALATMPGAAVSAVAVAAALAAEGDPQTRSHLYDAMRALAEPDPALLLQALRGEADPAARISALLSAGTLVGMGLADQATEAYFTQEAVPELEASATAAALPTESRLRAVSALRNAGTDAAIAALDRLAQHSPDEVVRRLAASPRPRRGP